MVCQLVFLNGPRAGNALRFEQASFWIGRDPQCELALDPMADATASARHAQIALVGGSYQLRDHSTNGTFINGQPVKEAALREGDVLELGRGGPQLRFSLLAVEDSPPAREPSVFCQLVFLNGPRAGSSLRFEQASFWIGRDPRCELALDPVADRATVSARHAEISLAEHGYQLRDQSTYGTFVNGQPVKEAALHDGDVLELGRGGPQLRLSLLGSSVPPHMRPATVPAPAARSTARRRWPVVAGLLLLAAGAGVTVFLLLRPAAVDLAAGGEVTVKGVTLIFSPRSGKGRAQVTVERAPAETKDTSSRLPITDIFSVELRQRGQGVSKLKRAIVLALPFRDGLAADKVRNAHIVVKTRQGPTDPWRVENAMPSVDLDRRRLILSVAHLTQYEGEVDLAEATSAIPPQPNTPWVRGEYSYGGFLIRYYKTPAALAPPPGWTPSPEHRTPYAAPAYVLDLARFLNLALNHHVRISSNTLFDRGQLSLPVVVYVQSCGGDAGCTPIGGPPTISNNKTENANDMSVVAAHELVHVLQGRYFIQTVPAGAAYNRWFVEATADLYARRAFPKVGLGYWFKDSSQYLSVSLYANEEQSYYAVAHFLDWLEHRLSRPVAASALASSRPDKWAALVAEVNQGKDNIGDLFVEYCRGMWIGTLAPQGGQWRDVAGVQVPEWSGTWTATRTVEPPSH